MLFIGITRLLQSSQTWQPFAPVGHCFTVTADTLATAFTGGRVSALHDGLSGPGGGFASPSSPCMRYVHGYESLVGAGKTSAIPVGKHWNKDYTGKWNVPEAEANLTCTPQCRAYLTDGRSSEDTSPAIVDEAYAHRAWSEIRRGLVRSYNTRHDGYIPPVNMGMLLTGSCALSSEQSFIRVYNMSNPSYTLSVKEFNYSIL